MRVKLQVLVGEPGGDLLGVRSDAIDGGRRAAGRSWWSPPPSRAGHRLQLGATLIAATVLRASPSARAIDRWLSPACARRTTSSTSIQLTS